MSVYNKICVFDLETNGKDPNVCCPVEIAAVIIDPRTLEITSSEFSSFIKPDFSTNDPSTVEWHAKLHNCPSEEILKQWETYPDPKLVWGQFRNFLDLHHIGSKKSGFSACIAAGMNIRNFDLKITDRYNKLYSDKEYLFKFRDCVDLLDIFYLWFNGNAEVTSFSMDVMREYLGIKKDGAHTAIKDVKDTAEIISRFLKLHKHLSQKIKFKGAFSNG